MRVFSAHAYGGEAGPATGISFTDTDGSTIECNFVSDIHGASATENWGEWCGNNFDFKALGAQRIRLGGTNSNCVVSGNVVSSVITAGEGESGESDGLHLDGLTACTMTNNTLHKLMGTGRGVYVGPGQDSLVVISDTILSSVEGPCLENAPANPADLLVAQHSDLFACAGGLQLNATVEPTCISADPKLVDAEGGDFHLLPDSPCIDTGDPAGTCSNEPAPMGVG